MLEWIWGCVILALKVAVGSFAITVSFWVAIGIIAVIVFIIKEMFFN